MDTVAALSADESKAVHRIGDESAFMPGGYDIAALAAGAALCATDAVLLGRMANAYALTRWGCWQEANAAAAARSSAW